LGPDPTIVTRLAGQAEPHGAARPVVVAVAGGSSQAADALRALAAAPGVQVRLAAAAAPGAAAHRAAVELGIPVSASLDQLIADPTVEVVLDLSDDEAVRRTLERTTGGRAEVLGASALRLLGGLLEEHRHDIERDRVHAQLQVAYERIQAQEQRLRSSAEALERSNEDLQTRLSEIYFTHQFFRALTSYTTVSDVSSLIVDGANGILGAEVSAVYLLGEDATSMTVLAAQGRPASELVRVVPGTTTILGRAVRRGLVTESDVDPLTDSACWLEDPASISSQSAVPLSSALGPIAVLVVASPRRRVLTGAELERLQAIADQAALALQNALLHQELETLSVTDRLTELYNHGFFHQRLVQELTRSKRFGHPLSLVMLDIDDFKSFNDAFGHPRGDDVLRIVSSAVRGALRDMDLPARYGGEEFTVILPETGPEGALKVAERIRAGVAGADLVGRPGEPAVHRTVSVGVATFPDNATSAAGLVEAADRAMYRAKRAGKDRVCAAGREAPEPRAADAPGDSTPAPSGAAQEADETARVNVVDDRRPGTRFATVIDDRQAGRRTERWDSHGR
jgi:diguanylate cyclase (GGDEF)-like protein